jgi:hypothetical protein
MRGTLVFGALLVVSELIACSGAQDHPSTVMRPVEERRARGVIERALLDNGMRPAEGRVVTLPGNASLTEDLAIEGERYGIAYLTAPEAEHAGKAVPPFNPDDDQLRLVAGQDGTITLVLYEQNYRYDAGETHEATVITAEKKLARDVSDFVLHYVKQRKEE